MSAISRFQHKAVQCLPMHTRSDMAESMDWTDSLSNYSPVNCSSYIKLYS